MGLRGKAPTPTAQLAPTSWRRKQRAKTEPKAKSGKPRMPTDLSESAKRAWPKFVAIMPPGVLSTSDGVALAALCEIYIDWRRCVDFVRKYGEYEQRIKTNADGSKSPYFEYYPQAAKRLMYEKRLSYWLARFGLTPADRSQVVVDPAGLDEPGGLRMIG